MVRFRGEDCGAISPFRFITHSSRVATIAKRYGWSPGARYTNLRDVKHFDRLGFLDVDWKRYDFRRHLSAARATQPFLTVARDVQRRCHLRQTIDEAWELSMYAQHVVIVPKFAITADELQECVPRRFLLGYSVPSRYGQTHLNPRVFTRPVHLLGGRPDVQRQLAKRMHVFSFDCNRFTLDAQFGDYFDGETFRPHPVGGYERCIVDSLKNINRIWDNYTEGTRYGTGRHQYRKRSM